MNAKTTKNKNTISPENCIALLFPNLRTASSSGVLKSIANHLKQRQIDAYMIPTEEIQQDVTNFKKLETDDEFMQRMATTITEIINGIPADKRKHILFVGVSAGARLMSAYALANKLGYTQGLEPVTIHGFIGYNVSTSLRLSKPTRKEIKELQQINQMDYKNNMAYFKDTMIYDVYVDRDSVSSETATARAERYKKQGLAFKLQCINSCDYTDTEYYEKKGDDYFLYTEVSAHTLQNAYLMKDDGSFELAHRLHGEEGAPVENSLDEYLAETGTLKLQ